MPPHHPIFGHIFTLAGIMAKLPKDAHPHYLADQLRRSYPDMGPIFYLDAWPFITLTLVVASPSTLAQITTEHVLPKFPAIKDFLFPLANGQDLVSMDGQEWKYWRDMFNPGFSTSHLMTQVPEIVKETMTFLDILNDHARKQDVFRMKNLTDNLAMDVIGRVVLYEPHNHSQRAGADLSHSPQRFEFGLPTQKQPDGRRTSSANALDGIWQRRQPIPAISPVSAFGPLV
jgi:cytochrome P450